MTEKIWRVEIHGRFYKKLAKLPRTERETILTALANLPKDPFTMDFKPLRGRTDWRLRVGHWRILLRMDLGAKVLVAYEFGTRGDVYK